MGETAKKKRRWRRRSNRTLGSPSTGGGKPEALGNTEEKELREGESGSPWTDGRRREDWLNGGGKAKAKKTGSTLTKEDALGTGSKGRGPARSERRVTLKGQFQARQKDRSPKSRAGGLLGMSFNGVEQETRLYASE